MKQAQDINMTEDEAREVLGLTPDMWTLQFNDEELRMLQEIMHAEQARREAVFGNLLEKVESCG